MKTELDTSIIYIPEFVKLPDATIRIIDILGPERFLDALSNRRTLEKIGDPIWNLFVFMIASGNDQKGLTKEDTDFLQYLVTKDFQTLVARKMRLSEIVEKYSGEKIGSKTLSQALESLFGELFLHTNINEVMPILVGIFKNISGLLTEKDRMGRSFQFDANDLAQVAAVDNGDTHIIPEYDSLPKLTKNVINILGPKKYLEILENESDLWRVGDAVWNLFISIRVSKKGRAKLVKDRELHRQYLMTDDFQKLVAEKMGLESTSKKLLENLLGALLFRLGIKKSMSILNSIINEIFGLLSEEEINQRIFRDSAERKKFPDKKTVIFSDET